MIKHKNEKATCERAKSHNGKFWRSLQATWDTRKCDSRFKLYSAFWRMFKCLINYTCPIDNTYIFQLESSQGGRSWMTSIYKEIQLSHETGERKLTIFNAKCRLHRRLKEQVFRQSKTCQFHKLKLTKLNRQNSSTTAADSLRFLLLLVPN